ncbi:MAG: GlsB/YeaQ/YmgE family stress response membrane protein [Planctomycetes bacterium]|nr:GlsB/YeaQ/YmgE family stress response membrane protein [Planctomycetota bacterium]
MNGFDPAQDLVLNDSAQQLVSDVLIWIGFGTLVGLLAKGVMPGRDPGGAVATILMGIGGTVIGCGVLSFFREGQRVVPVSPMGMLVGVVGSMVILFFYKLLGGYYFVEGEYVTRTRRRRRRGSSRRRRYDSAIYED